MASETVSVVFTDLVGSTEILSQLGETRAEVLRREFFALLREGATAHEGREVKNLGDGLMLVFPSASDAVRGMVTIQRLAREFNRTAEVPLLIRAGGSTGDADAVDDDYFGVAVVEAARLCAHCGNGQILVTETMRHLARDRAEQRYDSVGALELKGLDQPVATCEVLWEPLEVETPAWPLPGRLERGGAFGFVGRRAELARCEEILKHVDASGQRRVVLFGGEAGIGKTSLVGEFARSAHGQDAIVLYGRCDEGLGVAYQPWVEALGHLVRHVGAPALEAHVAARGSDLLPLVADLAERVDELPPPRSDDPDTSRRLLFSAVVDLLRRVSADRSMLIVLDDLHWADRTTVQLLHHVATAAEETRLVLVGTYREADIGPTHPLTDLLASLHREEGVDRMVLVGLDDLELADLMEATAGHSLDSDALELRDALARETSGNPFFVSELLRHLAETGAIAQDDTGRWRAQVDLRVVGLPVSVREVVGRRVAHLGDDARKMLSAAAVIGREFELEVLTQVTGTDEDELVEFLEEAVAAAVIAEVPGNSDRYAFVHALTQHTLYDELGAARRRRLHRLVAEALESVAGGVVENAADLAGHWLEATRPDDLEKAYGYALLAGDQAQARLAPDEAVHWYAQALDLVQLADDGSQRTECLLRLGTAQRLAGAPEFRQTLLDAASLAEQRDDADRLAAAALANFRGFFSLAGSSDPERIAVLDAALDHVGDEHLALRARLLARLAVETIFAPDRSPWELLDAALAAAETSGSDDARIDALLALGTYFTPASLERRLERMPALLELAARSGDPARRFWATEWAVLAWAQAGRFSEAKDALAEQRGYSEQLGDPFTELVVSMNEQMFAAAAGDLDEAERLATVTLERGVALAEGHPDAPLFGGSQLGVLTYVRGDWQQGAQLLEMMLDEFDLPVVHAGYAGCLLRVGRTDDAREIARTLETFDVEGTISRDPISGATLATLALVARLFSPALLDRLATVLSGLRGQLLISGASIIWPADLGRALVLTALHRWDDAEHDFAEALTISQALPMPLATAWIQWEWAEMLAQRGDPSDKIRIRDLAGSALRLAETHGCPGVALACAQLLEANADDGRSAARRSSEP